MAEVRHVALPMRGKRVKVLPVGVAPVAAIGPVGSLIGLPLVPEDGPNPVGEPGGPHPGEEPSIDRGRIGAFGGVGKVLIDPRAADGAVEDADRDLVGVDEMAGEIDPPISDLVLSPLPPYCVAPPRLEAPLHRAEAPDPTAASGLRAIVDLVGAPVARHRVRLAVHQEGVAAEEIVGGVEDHLLSVTHRAGLDPVADEPRLERDREGVAALRIGLEQPRVDERAVGEKIEVHALGRGVESTAEVERADILVIAGKELPVDRQLIGVGVHGGLDPGIGGRLGDEDLRRRHDGRAAIVDPRRHREPAAVLTTLEDEAFRGLLVDKRRPFRVPVDVERSDACGLERRAIGDPGNDPDRLPAIPGGGGLEREDGIGDRLANRDRDVDGLGTVRIHGTELEHGLLVPRHPPGVDVAAKRVGGHDPLLAVAAEDPGNLERPAGPGGDAAPRPFGEIERRS